MSPGALQAICWTVGAIFMCLSIWILCGLHIHHAYCLFKMKKEIDALRKRQKKLEAKVAKINPRKPAAVERPTSSDPHGD